MKVFRGFDSLPTFHNAVATMGSFDGVHCGHRALLERVICKAKEIGGESVVLTFDPHPRYVLGTGGDMKLLSTIEEKILLLDQAGIDNLIIIPFTPEFSRTSPEEFIKSLATLGIRSMVVGYNHRFGHKKEGDYNYLSAHDQGMEIAMVEQQQVANGKVSSTIIRQSIEAGKMESVTQMLSRPYIIIGKLEKDNSISGIDQHKLLPPPATYRVKVNGSKNSLTINTGGELKLETSVDLGEVLIEME